MRVVSFRLMESHSNELRKAAEECEALIGSLSSVVLATAGHNSQPLASYAPVYVDDSRRLHVYVSSLAKHTALLRRTGKASAMFIEDESASSDLFARKRLSVDCDVSVIPRETPEWGSLMDAMEDRLGDTVASLRGLVDFDLFQLVPTKGRLILGFGQAYRVFGENLSQIDFLRGGSGHKTK